MKGEAAAREPTHDFPGTLVERARWLETLPHISHLLTTLRAQVTRSGRRAVAHIGEPTRRFPKHLAAIEAHPVLGVPATRYR